MIQSFKCKETQKLFYRESVSNFSENISRIALRKLNIIHATHSLNDLRVPPSNHLEKRKGKKKGMYSIRINQQWRICFEWKNGDAYHVEIIDYH